MGKNIDTQALIARVYHHNSTQGRNLAQLADEYTSNNNTMGIALVRQVLTTVADKLPNGKKFSGHIVPKYLNHEKTGVGQRIGKATISGQALREGHSYSITLYDRNGEVQARAGRLKKIGHTKAVPDFLVGNEHKETLERILAANFEPAQLERFRQERDATYEHASSLADDFDTLFERFGVPKDIMGSYRRMLLLGPISVGDDDSVLATLSDPHALRGDLAWLKGSIDTLPEQVQDAYHRFTSTVTRPTPEDAATLVAAIYQFKQEKAEGIIGSFRDDVRYMQKLDEDHDVIKAVGKPDLDMELEPLSFFAKGRSAAKRKGCTLDEMLGKQFITRADALALMRQLPVYEAREVHNRALAARYCGNDLPALLEAACESATIEAKRYHDAKKHEERFVPEMLKDEYKDARYAATLAGYAKSRLTESDRDALVRLLPMTRANHVFSSIARVARKKKANIPLDRSMTLIEDISFDNETLDKLAWVPRIGRENAGVQNKYLAGRAGMTLDKLGELQGTLRFNEQAIAYGLVPEGVALLDVRLPDANKRAMADALGACKHVGDDAALVQRLLTLREEPIALSIRNRHADDGRVTSAKTHPRFTIEAYNGARYLTQQQRSALKKIAGDVKLYVGDACIGADMTSLRQRWEDVLAQAKAGAVFYDGELTRDCAVRLEQRAPQKQALVERCGLSFRNPQYMKECADALEQGVVDGHRRDLIVRVRAAQHNRAPGYDEKLGQLLEGKAYLIRPAADALEQAYAKIIDKSYPLHVADGIGADSLDAYHQRKWGYTVDIRSNAKKPWLEVLDTFSKKRGGEGAPYGFQWDIKGGFGDSRLSAKQLSFQGVETLARRLAEQNREKGTKLYLTLQRA